MAYTKTTRKQQKQAERSRARFIVSEGTPLVREQIHHALAAADRRASGETDPQPVKGGGPGYNMAPLEVEQRRWRIDRKRKRLNKRWDKMRAARDAEKAKEAAAAKARAERDAAATEGSAPTDEEYVKP
jgi:hypothetical protein